MSLIMPGRGIVKASTRRASSTTSPNLAFSHDGMINLKRRITSWSSVTPGRGVETLTVSCFLQARNGTLEVGVVADLFTNTVDSVAGL
jgi:hypothetical protein